MTTESERAFRAFLESEPSLIRAPSYDATAEVSWRAAVAWATAREAVWLSMETAPKDTTMVRLLVSVDRAEGAPFTSFENSHAPYETIGFNQLDQTGEDIWEFAGWDWGHDCFTRGHGNPLGWLPLSSTVVDDRETTDIGGNDPRKNLGSLERYRKSDVGTSDSIKPLADLVKKALEYWRTHATCPGPSAVQILAAFAAEHAAEQVTQERVRDEETYGVGKQDGYSEAVQCIDRLTGGDGEYRFCTDRDPERHCPDASTMIDRIVDRLSSAETRAEAAEKTLAEEKATIAKCQWYWPEDDTDSEHCTYSPREVVELAYGWGGMTGEVVAVARGGIVEVTYCAALPPADDSGSDDEFFVEEKTEADAKAKINAEIERRAAIRARNPSPSPSIISDKEG